MENDGVRSEKTLRWITVITLPRLPTFSVAIESYPCHFVQRGSKIGLKHFRKGLFFGIQFEKKAEDLKHS